MERASHPAVLDPPGPATLGGHFPAAVTIGRWVSAVIASALMATVLWLTIMQEGHAGRILNHRWTDHDFPDGLGNALGATNPARTGLVATFVLAVGVVLLFALVERWLPGRSWIKGLSFAPVIFLLWGLVFCPLINSQQLLVGDTFVYNESSVFATESGKGAIASAIVASIVVGATLARVLQLVRTARWWEQSDPSRQIMVSGHAQGHVIEVPDDRLGQTDSDAPGASLELAEERTDERGEGTR